MCTAAREARRHLGTASRVWSTKIQVPAAKAAAVAAPPGAIVRQGLVELFGAVFTPVFNSLRAW